MAAKGYACSGRQGKYVMVGMLSKVQVRAARLRSLTSTNGPEFMFRALLTGGLPRSFELLVAKGRYYCAGGVVTTSNTDWHSRF